MVRVLHSREGKGDLQMRTLLLIPLAVLFGCAHGTTKAPEQAAVEPTPAPSEPAPVASAPQPAPESSKIAETTPPSPPNVACPPSRVHFAFDKSELKPDAKQ